MTASDCGWRYTRSEMESILCDPIFNPKPKARPKRPKRRFAQQASLTDGPVHGMLLADSLF